MYQPVKFTPFSNTFRDSKHKTKFDGLAFPNIFKGRYNGWHGLVLDISDDIWDYEIVVVFHAYLNNAVHNLQNLEKILNEQEWFIQSIYV